MMTILRLIPAAEVLLSVVNVLNVNVLLHLLQDAILLTTHSSMAVAPVNVHKTEEYTVQAQVNLVAKNALNMNQYRVIVRTI